MITVRDMMSPKPITLSRLNSLYDARMLMAEKSFRHVPIVGDDGELIGLVTQRNVLASGVSSQAHIDKDELAKIETGTLLADIMTTDLVTITAGASISAAAQLIHKHKFGCLPVVDDKGHLVGIITDHDFVEITMQLLDMMDASEPFDEDDEF